MELSELIPILHQSCLFLNEFSWLFNFANIKIFQHIKNWPDEWNHFLRTLSYTDQLKDIFLGKIPLETVPSFVSSFVERRTKLVNDLQRILFVADVQKSDRDSGLPRLPENLKKGMTCKKQHEVAHFSQHIHEQMKCDLHIVDVGAGLGYVDQILSHTWNHSVYGIESHSGHHNNALQRTAAGLVENAVIKNTQINFSLDSSDENRATLEDMLPKDNALFLIGLHSCGDLTPIMLNWFAQSSRVTGISVVSCCYHKIAQERSYPMSKALRLMKTNPLATVYARRLASQDSVESWLEMNEVEHRRKARVFYNRSLVETFCVENDLLLDKWRRKCYKNIDNNCESNFAQDVLSKFSFRFRSNNETLDSEDATNRLNQIHEKFQDKLIFLDLVIGLQSFLQILLELTIVGDRVVYLLELSFNPKVSRLFNARISPRGIVLDCQK